MKAHILAILATATLFCGCQEQHFQEIAPLYKDLANYRSLSEMQRDSLCHTDITKAFFEVVDHGQLNDTGLQLWSMSLPVEIFTPAVDSIFPTLEPIEKALGAILDNAVHEGLDLPKRKYAAVVWGNKMPILFVDSCMLVALNHYLGADYPGYSQWPRYQQLDKTPQRLPYDMAEALVATRYPFDGGEQPTALSRMLYEGALTLAKMHLVNRASLAEALGYSDQQLQWLNDNYADIWNKVVADKLLYDTSESTIDKLIAPAPFSSIIASNVPPRVGRYIGYRIVCDYLDHNSSTTLVELLSPKFYTDESVLLKSR